MIFERLRRGRRAQQKPVPGSGLGLAIALVHGTELTLTSGELEGNTITVRFQRKDA